MTGTRAENGTRGRTNRVGRHLPTSGGLLKTLEAAAELGCEAAQIFVSNPQAWAIPAPRPDAEAFLEGSRELGISPVVVHAKYLINLASDKEDSRERSARVLARELVLAGGVGAEFVVVHCGSHGGDGEDKGEERLVAGLDEARRMADDWAGPDGPVAEPVIENSVGAGTQLCSTLAAVGGVARRAGVRVCLDTAHAFVAGHDISSPEGAGAFVQELESSLGPALALVHLNDAKNGLGSHRDGHRKVGEGRVPEAAWRELLARLAGVPLVMETPYAGPEADALEVRAVKELAGGLHLAAGGG